MPGCFAGPRGIGKATLAYRFARFVLAGGEGDGGDGLAMAPEHAVFRRIAAGGHSDLAVIERGLGDRGRLRAEIVVDDVRKANAFLSLTAGEGGWRVVIVDAADEMNRNAANALLKRLEEPPSRVLFLLVSHAPSRVPATLRSRCRLLTLSPLPAPALDGLLADAMPTLPPAERNVLGLLAEGSPGRAAALAEQGGVALYRRLIALVGALPTLDVRPLHQLADGLGGRDGGGPHAHAQRADPLVAGPLHPGARRAASSSPWRRSCPARRRARRCCREPRLIAGSACGKTSAARLRRRTGSTLTPGRS